jgi:NTP pyrophosphatase (non-canonical NTP hydrolase)
MPAPSVRYPGTFLAKPERLETLDCPTMQLAQFQDLMGRTYLERDRRRGIDGTFRRLVEEVGELAKALRRDDPDARRDETSDVVAWLASLANQAGVDLEAAAARYEGGCPKCGAIPCACPYGP